MNLLRADRELTRNSYYAATSARTQSFPALQGTVECDLAVVGGGLAGLSAALEAAQAGMKVVLLEARHIGFGASGRNGGQAIHGLACEQQVIEAQLGPDEARRVWDLSIDALDLLRQRIRDHGIDCDWQDGYLGVAEGPAKGRSLAAWADHIESRYAYPLRRIGAAEMPQWITSPRYHSAVHDPRSGHLHPLKYTRGLARAAAAAGAQIHEDSEVTALVQSKVCELSTAQGRVRAAQVLLAGNVYLQGLAPQLRARIMPVGTFIGCTEVLGAEEAAALIPCRAAVCDNHFVLDYFRTTADHRMLYGGRASYGAGVPPHLADGMQQRMLKTFPQLKAAKMEFAWGGFVDISMNRAPDFGRLGPHRNLYYLQGFSGHGLALSGLAGQMVAQAIQGDASRFDTFARIRHHKFPGGPALRMPALVLGMAWYRLKDALA